MVQEKHDWRTLYARWDAIIRRGEVAEVTVQEAVGAGAADPEALAFAMPSGAV